MCSSDLGHEVAGVPGVQLSVKRQVSLLTLLLLQFEDDRSLFIPQRLQLTRQLLWKTRRRGQTLQITELCIWFVLLLVKEMKQFQSFSFRNMMPSVLNWSDIKIGTDQIIERWLIGPVVCCQFFSLNSFSFDKFVTSPNIRHFHHISFSLELREDLRTWS